MDEDLKNQYKKEYSKFKKYLHIQGMEELRDIIISLRTNENIINLSKNHFKLDLFTFFNAKEDNEFLYNGIEALKQSFFFSFNWIDDMALYGLYNIIGYSLTAQCACTLSNEEMTYFISNDLIAKIILAQENYFKIDDVPLLSKEFFQKFRKMKKGKGVRKINHFLYSGYYYKTIDELGISSDLLSESNSCSAFLAACYALKDNHEIITKEDLVKGWTLTLKLLITDLRPYIFNQESKFYNPNIDFRKYRNDLLYGKKEDKLRKSLFKFDKYSHIPRMDELKEALISLRDNEKYIYLSSAKDKDTHAWYNKYEKEFASLKNAKKYLDNNRINFSHNTNALCFKGIYGLIIFSCMADYRHSLSDNEKEQIFNSDFVPNLFYNLDDFSHVHTAYSINENFFKEYKKINKFPKDSDELDSFLRDGYIFYLEMEYNIDRHIMWAFRDCAIFLANTYALHRNSYDVSCEDIVNGWLLTLKLFSMDLRPLIFDEFKRCNNV